ncbi:MAG: hypothetical protein ACRC8A_09590 [Microcoleaceae cyanobacterium]
MQLGQILVQKQLVSTDQLYEALSLQISCSKKLGEILLESGTIHEQDLRQALKEQSWRQNGFWIID